MGGRLQPSKYPLQSPQIDCLWDRLYLFPADRKHRPITKQPLILDFLHVHFLSFFLYFFVPRTTLYEETNKVIK